MAGRTVNKAELIDVMAQKADLTKAAARDALEALLAEISATLRRRDKVQITGFGSFEARHREARTARNPQTGMTVFVGEKWLPAFKAGQSLKDDIA
jgi:DNA-binding protein HU-alpha